MKRLISMSALALVLTFFWGCKKQVSETTPSHRAMTQAELSALANAVPQDGLREGNNYKVFFLALHQNQKPAVGFKVDVWVKGKSEPVTVRTNEQGLAQFDSLPFPEAKNKLEAVLHYYKGAEDQPREITYPYIVSDAYRLKDVQYIPNTVTPDPS